MIKMPFVFVLVLLSLVCGCATEENFFRNRAEDYKDARIYPKLALPKTAIKPDNEGGYYDIPSER